MRIWEAHIALSRQIGDPISVTGSPPATIPDGVRYSRALRDIYLYRSALNIVQQVITQAAQLPDKAAHEIIARAFPNYIVEDNLGVINNNVTDEYNLTRRPAWVYSVHTDNYHQFQKSSLPRFNSYSNPYVDGRPDPMYVLVPGVAPVGIAPYANGRIRITYPNGFIQTSGTNRLFCAYLPTPLNPATQAVNDVLDMEPLYYETLLQAAAQMALSDSQEVQMAR
jgi:hypothetical protein